MPANTLPDAVIVAAALGAVQLAKSLVPQMVTWPNNAVRALTFALTYAMIVVNHLVTGPLTWQGAWGLLPLAGALSGSATLIYHLATESAPRAPSSSAPAETPDRRLLSVPAGTAVSLTVPPSTVSVPSPLGISPAPAAAPTITTTTTTNTPPPAGTESTPPPP